MNGQNEENQLTDRKTFPKMTDQVKMIKIPRQTAFLKMPKEDVEKYLKEVESHFGKAWLETQAGHRLQILWERSDSNSTIDLVSLGYALKTISERHPEWLSNSILLPGSSTVA
jgi:hypothetical protein